MKEKNIKEQLIDVAKKLFAEKGFDGTSTRNIVNYAGVNISLISYYFGSKENLLYSLFDVFIFNKNFSYDENIIDKEIIKEFIEELTNLIRLRFEEPELVTILHHEIILKSKRGEKLKNKMIPLWKKISFILRIGKERGIFNYKNLGNALSFTMSVATFPRQNQYFSELSYEDSINEEDVIKELLEFILKGLSFNIEMEGEKI